MSFEAESESLGFSGCFLYWFLEIGEVPIITNSSNGISQVLRKAVYFYGTRNVLTGLRSFPLAPSSFVLKLVLKKNLLSHSKEGLTPPLSCHSILWGIFSFPSFYLFVPGPWRRARQGGAYLICSPQRERRQSVCCAKCLESVYLIFGLSLFQHELNCKQAGAAPSRCWNSWAVKCPLWPSRTSAISMNLARLTPVQSWDTETDRGHCTPYQCKVLATRSGVVATQESQWE